MRGARAILISTLVAGFDLALIALSMGEPPERFRYPLREELDIALIRAPSRLLGVALATSNG